MLNSIWVKSLVEMGRVPRLLSWACGAMTREPRKGLPATLLKLLTCPELWLATTCSMATEEFVYL